MTDHAPSLLPLLKLSVLLHEARRRYDTALSEAGVKRVSDALEPHLGKRGAEERARNIVTALLDGEEDPSRVAWDALSPEVLRLQGWRVMSQAKRRTVASVVAWHWARRDAALAIRKEAGQ